MMARALLDKRPLGNYDIARFDFFAERAEHADRDNALHAERGERFDRVRSMGRSPAAVEKAKVFIERVHGAAAQKARELLHHQLSAVVLAKVLFAAVHIKQDRRFRESRHIGFLDMHGFDMRLCGEYRIGFILFKKPVHPSVSLKSFAQL